MAARDCGGSTTPHPRALWAPLRVALHSNHADWCMPWEQHRRPGPREKLETCTCVCAVVQPEESALLLLLTPPSRDFQACHCHALLPTHTRYQCVCKREAHLFSGNVNIHRGNTEDSFGCGCSGQGRGEGAWGRGAWPHGPTDVGGKMAFSVPPCCPGWHCLGRRSRVWSSSCRPRNLFSEV